MLIRFCLQGDECAWDELVERYGRLVYSIPRRLGLSETDADDVFQVVFGIVLRKLDTLRDVERLSAWLIRVTYRESWRVSARRPSNQAPVERDLPAEDAPGDEQIEALERQNIVRQSLTELGGRCQELLEALFFEPQTPDYEEIAARLGMKIGSIGPTRARCFQKLEALLRKHGF
jgi:RNA polymerase sigma factor (sigma-70 family)